MSCRLRLGALLGWWKIASFHVELEDTGECVETYGVDPLGHMVITGDRMMSILTSRERTDKDAAALFETMMAYSGSCRIEDEVRLVIKVDAARHPAWSAPSNFDSSMLTATLCQ
jgi:lipocalin-like protein